MVSEGTQVLGVDIDGNNVALVLNADGFPTKLGKLIITDKDTHFTGAIVQNAKEDENISVVSQGISNDRFWIIGVAIQCDEALDYDLFFWSTDGFDNTDLDLDTFLDWVDLDVAADGVRIGAANQYYLGVRLRQPLLYIDDDADLSSEPKVIELHISLVNRSAAAKTAGAAGEVKIILVVEPI